MKNFTKKLSFVMATAMVVTSLYAPQDVSAATSKMVVKGSTAAVTSKNIYLTGQTVNFDPVINGKKTGFSGTWKSSDTSVATVGKGGIVKVVGAGKAVISYKTKKTAKAASKTVKVTVYGRVRANALTLSATDAAVKVGEKVEVTATFGLSDKVKAAGATDSTYFLTAEASSTAAAVTVDGKKVVVEGLEKSATPVTVKVYGAQTTSLEKAKTIANKVVAEFTVKVNGKLEAKQTGAGKITVKGSNLTTSAAAYVIKNANGVVFNIKDTVKVNEDRTEAVLESAAAQIPAAKYTVQVADDTAEFEAVKSVVAKIVISPDDKAVLADSTAQKAYAYYKVYNNFDEDVTSSTTVDSNITVTGSDGAAKDATKGRIVVTKTGTDKFQVNLSKVSVAVVDKTNGVNASAILTVVDEAKLAEVEFKGVYNTSTKKFVDKIAERDTLTNFKLLFTGKDQYGMDKNVAADLTNVLSVNFVSATGLDKVNMTTTVEEVDGVKYMALALKSTNTPPNTDLRSGSVQVMAVSLTTGKKADTTVEVVPSAKVAELKVTLGSTGIYEGEKNELAFTAYDTEGKVITDIETLSRMNGTTSFNASKLSFEVKNDGKVALYYNTAGIGKGIQVLSWLSETNKFDTLQVTIQEKRVPTVIAGVKKDVAVGVTKGKDLVFKIKDLVFNDQYGNVLDFDTTKFANYRIQADVTGSANSFDAQSASTAAISAAVTGSAVVISNNAVGTDSGSTSVKFSLYKLDGAEHKLVAGSEATVTIYSVKVEDIASVTIDDIKLKEIGTTVNPTVWGTYNGQKVTLVAGSDYNYFGDTNNVPDNAAFVADPKLTATKAAVTVIVNDGKGTQKTKEYMYSAKPRELASVDFVDKNATSLSGVATTAQGWTEIGTLFAGKDQYDNSIALTAPFITFTKVTGGIDIANNGLTTATVALKAGVPTAIVKVRLQFTSTLVVEKNIILNQ